MKNKAVTISAADLIVQARDAKCISMNELARRCKRDVSHIWRLEHGRQEPTLPILRSIAKALECDLVINFVPIKII